LLNRCLESRCGAHRVSLDLRINSPVQSHPRARSGRTRVPTGRRGGRACSSLCRGWFAPSSLREPPFGSVGPNQISVEPSGLVTRPLSKLSEDQQAHYIVLKPDPVWYFHSDQAHPMNMTFLVSGNLTFLRFWRTFSDSFRPVFEGVRKEVALVIFAPAHEARMLRPEHGGSDPGLSSAEGWRDPDAAADLSLFLYLLRLWSGFGRRPLHGGSLELCEPFCQGRNPDE
jgi:hypothetical protein